MFMVQLGHKKPVEQLEAFGGCSKAIWADPWCKHKCGSTYDCLDQMLNQGFMAGEGIVGFS